MPHIDDDRPLRNLVKGSSRAVKGGIADPGHCGVTSRGGDQIMFDRHDDHDTDRAMTPDTLAGQNLVTQLPDAALEEVFDDILRLAGCRIERIVSHGQVTPPDRPYCQAHDEWVLVLTGGARVEVEGVLSELRPGDHLFIPARARHRVTFTRPDCPTVWIAVHVGESTHQA